MREQKIAEAVHHCNEAISMAPRAVAPCELLARVLFSQGKYDASLVCSCRVLALAPNNAEAQALKAINLWSCRQFSESVEAFDAALELTPDNASLLFGQGLSLMELGRPEQAMEKFRKARAMDPGQEKFRMGFAESALRIGDFAAGWLNYSARLTLTPTFKNTKLFPGAPWRGQKTSGSLLLAHEQGIGDLVFFLRYAQLARSRCGHLTVQAPRAAMPLVATAPGVDAALDVIGTEKGETVEGFDYWAPVGSLPDLLGVKPTAMPAERPYFEVPPDRADRARSWLANLPGSGPRVGIVWAGRSGFSRDDRRSLAFAGLLPIFALPNICFVSLQHGKRGDEAFDGRVPGLLHDARPLMGDFLDTAALIAGLDLLISCDTGVANLGGALAAPVWTLAEISMDWRWFCGADGKPAWYPTARVFRQHAPGSWDQALADLRAALLDRFQLCASA